jgi:hypothetical protein
MIKVEGGWRVLRTGAVDALGGVLDGRIPCGVITAGEFICSP